MELPQPRPFGTAQGRKPAHNFLSLYSPSQQQDTIPPQGGYLKTRDFLQLDQVGTNMSQEVNKVVTSVEKPLPSSTPPSVEHILPGGIGTYSISHISSINASHRVPKPEGVVFTAQSSSSERNDENSNCSSYAGSGFTLWEESVMKKGKTGKENIASDSHVLRDAGMRIGAQWTSMERPSQSSSNHNHRSTAFSSLPSQPLSTQKNNSFVDMIKSAKSSQEDMDDVDEEVVIKKETSPHHKVKIDAMSTDQKPNTPRSKHSATEQRRRSKINDRFSMLRELIPHSDQKRDKASFLLEVIEYIHFLQEKVQKYEHPYQGWNNEPPKLIPWSNNQRPNEGFIDQPRVSNCIGPQQVCGAKMEENNAVVSPATLRNGHVLVESDLSSADTVKELCRIAQLPNKTPTTTSMLQPNIFASGKSSSIAAELLPRLATNTDNTASHPQLWQGRSCTPDCASVGDKLKAQELSIESGTISISAIYSQGLLNNLTQALQSSGVDLSHASISVQIDLGKRANSLSSSLKKNDNPLSSTVLARSRPASTADDSDKVLKRFKTSTN